MVAFKALHALRRSRVRGRRPAPVEPGSTSPEPVAITRATVIAAEPFADARAAAEWLRGCGSGREASAAAVEDALAQVNFAVSAHRIAAQDPHVRDLGVAHVQRVRVGYGTGDEVVEGAWREALAIPLERARRSSRRRMLSPQEEMAGILSGRRPGSRPSEELLLRARLDLEQGRVVEAALVAHAAAQALAAELTAEDRGEGARAQLEPAAELVRAALGGELSAAQTEELAQLVERLERVTRRRRYADER